MLYLKYVSVLLCIIGITSGSASNSYQDCLQLVSKFSRTVTNGPVADIRMTTGYNVTCSQLSNISCPGRMVNEVCTYQQKLALTCINGSTVRIRVQSNGLPRRCSLVPLTVRIVEMNIDFEVNFNPDVSVNVPVQSPTTVADLSKLLCNITNHASVPAISNFVKSQNASMMDTVAGVAVDGVSIFNVNSANLVDPFYPNPTTFPTEGADQCLSHPGGGGELHYHVASGCMVNPPSGNLTGCGPDIGCLNNVANYSIQMFSSYRVLTVIGIAKDGHIIYGPYLSTGTQVTSGFDICNGMFHDSIGNYGYFATNTYPYVTGCFGPGNYPNVKPNCTTNPATSYVKSSYASSFSTSTSSPSTVSKGIPLNAAIWLPISSILATIMSNAVVILI
ncbi:unnamed protein product [Adineta ricciae]|uniref:YHYH domain-containing protein n=1 Tax=Adineta ricciae TaxID=249248 RepID=A0A815NS88_ADIRI|nr:unnamed protein product [Adineta ricciae]CAF1433464.1 unnamed protein product [Adineta ricciae]